MRPPSCAMSFTPINGIRRMSPSASMAPNSPPYQTPTRPQQLPQTPHLQQQHSCSTPTPITVLTASLPILASPYLAPKCKLAATDMSLRVLSTNMNMEPPPLMRPQSSMGNAYQRQPSIPRQPKAKSVLPPDSLSHSTPALPVSAPTSMAEPSNESAAPIMFKATGAQLTPNFSLKSRSTLLIKEVVNEDWSEPPNSESIHQPILVDLKGGKS
ncbi:hypothetical protein C0995_006662, partial [Termitomyces sp. Mi166